MSEVKDEADKKPNPKNLMNSEHKATNDAYRDGYDRVFRKKESFDTKNVTFVFNHKTGKVSVKE